METGRPECWLNKLGRVCSFVTAFRKAVRRLFVLLLLGVKTLIRPLDVTPCALYMGLGVPRILHFRMISSLVSSRERELGAGHKRYSVNAAVVFVFLLWRLESDVLSPVVADCRGVGVICVNRQNRQVSGFNLQTSY